MTDTIDAVMADEVVNQQQQLAEQLLAQAKTQGINLVAPGGLLNEITKRVLEAALEAEMSEHLGYDKHEYIGRDGGNSRSGVRPKTVLTEIGPRFRSTCPGTPMPRSIRRSRRSAAPVDRCRPNRVVFDCKEFDDRRDLRALRGVVRTGRRLGGERT
jgi:hypothetical protein